MLIHAYIWTTSQGTAVIERLQERLKAQSKDFSLLQYDSYDDEDDDEEEEEDIAKVVKLVKD